MKQTVYFLIVALLLTSCNTTITTDQNAKKETKYLDYSEKSDKLSGGVRMIPIQTPSGEFKVWTKRVGNNPTMKVLLLHGGPGATHEYFESFDSFLPNAEIEYYYYDQLESAYSDQPSDSTLWELDRFVDEVEQVRKALGLDKNNFYLLGHSWGGILGIEYALKYQKNLKGLIISNMVSSIPSYIKYAQEVLGPQLDPEVLAEIQALEAANDFANPRYEELVVTNYYPKHVLRMPLDQWPDPVNRAFANLNTGVYVTMQGPSEFGIAGDAKLKNWDRSNDLSKINVPTLSIGGEYDTMDPKHMEWMAEQLPKGEYLHCPKGSHMAMYDDQETYFEGLIQFIKNVDQGE
ncbi:proline iminopeptidase-family hydrolase [Reichenbachiella sp.]|uniref:proline iminopeptidase-family hydrolase n=1 Tax=Reichenbachiella sp. TaxID=2184521 RepID=UPI003BB1C977